MATVTFEHVWKKYGDVVAVNVEEPERAGGWRFFVLRAPSGRAVGTKNRDTRSPAGTPADQRWRAADRRSTRIAPLATTATTRPGTMSSHGRAR